MELEFPTESMIEDFICSESVNNSNCPITDRDYDSMYRQLSVGVYGITDIVYLDYYEDDDSIVVIDVTVLELKKMPLMAKDIAQLMRYMKGISASLSKYQKKLNFNFNVNGVLAGKRSKEKDFCFLAESIENVEVFEIGLSMGNGFTKTSLKGDWSRDGASFRDAGILARQALKNGDE